ncbi:hypothetical protein RhiLY_04945 [Ceratobasidium sp. AG-Ba]|nr:hypothetical protein RhiLY_04945 [Ceratobasidium sp. AG-Ba]
MPRSTPLGRLDSDPEADNGSVDRRDDEETGVISLPTINPFAGSARRGSPNRRRPPPSQPQDDDQDDEEEGVISLPTVNRFARGNHSGRGNPRRNRHPPEDDDQRRDRDRDDEEEGVISLPSVNRLLVTVAAAETRVVTQTPILVASGLPAHVPQLVQKLYPTPSPRPNRTKSSIAERKTQLRLLCAGVPVPFPPIRDFSDNLWHNAQLLSDMFVIRVYNGASLMSLKPLLKFILNLVCWK